MLCKAYDDSKHFIVHPTEERYEVTDTDRFKTRSRTSLKSIEELIRQRLMELTKPGIHTDLHIALEMGFLNLEYSRQMAPINQIGLEEAKRMLFNIPAIRKEVNAKLEREEAFGLMTYIHDRFSKGSIYTSKQIETILRNGLSALKLKGYQPNLRLLREYCKLSNKRIYIGTSPDGKRIDGYMIIGHLK